MFAVCLAPTENHYGIPTNSQLMIQRRHFNSAILHHYLLSVCLRKIISIIERKRDNKNDMINSSNKVVTKTESKGKSCQAKFLESYKDRQIIYTHVLIKEQRCVPSCCKGTSSTCKEQGAQSNYGKYLWAWHSKLGTEIEVGLSHVIC